MSSEYAARYRLGSRRPPPVGRLLVTAIMFASGAGPVYAQASPASRQLTMQDALRATLSGSPDIQIGARQVQIGMGELLSARGQFDPQLKASLLNDRANTMALGSNALVTSVVTSSLTYRLSMAKQLRSGIMITPEIGLTHVNAAGVASIPTNTATVGLDVLVPLLQDRGGAMVIAPERAATSEYEATVADLRHTTASSVLAAVTAYWNDVAAERSLDVYRASEARAQHLADETKLLVAADERPAGDMQQLLANLAVKRAARIAAEQREIEARQQLGLAMGLPAESIATLPTPTTPFPVLPQDTSSDTVALARAIQRALSRRYDLAAVMRRSNEAEALVEGARNGLQPRLDLTVGVGYAGLEPGAGLGHAFAPFYHNIPGLNASVQLSYGLPITNSTARGGAMQDASAFEQQRIVHDDLVRRISTGVAVAFDALRHSVSGLRESQHAVTFSLAAVDNEKRKFQLGMSTLFDIILAQDALTSAKLAVIAGKQSYALAIARVRYETATLVDVDGQTVTVNPGTVLTPP